MKLNILLYYKFSIKIGEHHQALVLLSWMINEAIADRPSELVPFDAQNQYVIIIMSVYIIFYNQAGLYYRKFMRYRSRIEIIAQILQAVNGSGGIIQTQIMYKALLGYAQMKQYLLQLIERDLLQYDNATNTFNITEKGIRFLNIYSEINQTQSPSANGPGLEEEEFVSSYADL